MAPLKCPNATGMPQGMPQGQVTDIYRLDMKIEEGKPE